MGLFNDLHNTPASKFDLRISAAAKRVKAKPRQDIVSGLLKSPQPLQYWSLAYASRMFATTPTGQNAAAVL